MMYTIREQAASIIDIVATDDHYDASEFATDLLNIARAGDSEIVTASKVNAVVEAARYAVKNSRFILLNPRYDDFNMTHRDPSIYGKYNTSVEFQLTGTSACDLMGFAYNTPAGCLYDFARAMEKQTANMYDVANSAVDLFNGAYTWREIDAMGARVECSADFISKVADVVAYIAPNVYMTAEEFEKYIPAAVSRCEFPLV